MPPSRYIGWAASSSVSGDRGVTPNGVQPTRVGLMGGGQAFTGHDLLWAMAWRTRSAAWMLRHRATLENALA